MSIAANEAPVDGWAIISQLVNVADQPALEQPAQQTSNPVSKKRGWPKGKPRVKRTAAAPVPPPPPPPAAAVPAGQGRSSRRPRSELLRNILTTPSGLYRPGWYPVKGRPLLRGKGFSSVEEAANNRELLEKFSRKHLDKYKVLTSNLYDVFAAAVDICAWRNEVTHEQLHDEVWERVKRLIDAKQELGPPARYKRRQLVRQPSEVPDFTIQQMAETKPSAGLSFLQGILNPDWRAPATLIDDVTRVARVLDNCFFQISRFANISQNYRIRAEEAAEASDSSS